MFWKKRKEKKEREEREARQRAINILNNDPVMGSRDIWRLQRVAQGSLSFFDLKALWRRR